MPRSYEFVLERSGPGDAARAFDLIRDADSWTSWAGPPISYSAWREGDANGSVIGQVRLVGKRQFPMAEEVTIDDRPHTHGYRIPARWPVRDYSARVDFIQTDGELTIRWSGRFVERIPGTGVWWRRYLQGFLGNLAERLIRHSAQVPTAP